MGPLPSSGSPNGFTTRPTNSSPTGTESTEGVHPPHGGIHPLPGTPVLEAENLAETDEVRHEEALRDSALRVPR